MAFPLPVPYFGHFVVLVAALLVFAGYREEEDLLRWLRLSLLPGALCSALAGFIGMKVVTKANVRTTNAACTSLGSFPEVAHWRSVIGSALPDSVYNLSVLSTYVR